jgi:hypothetical protein
MIFTVLTMLLSLVDPLCAQMRAAALDAHNTLRARHGVANLTWSGAVRDSAQAWADRCVIEHSAGGYGENLAMGHADISHAVQDWYDEISEYDFASPGFSVDTGHFTQVVWKDTRRVGCAKGNCRGFDWWVCQYDPPGNVAGRFQANVVPPAPHVVPPARTSPEGRPAAKSKARKAAASIWALVASVCCAWLTQTAPWSRNSPGHPLR